jgi:hypothetical protein
LFDKLWSNQVPLDKVRHFDSKNKFALPKWRATSRREDKIAYLPKRKSKGE